MKKKEKKEKKVEKFVFARVKQNAFCNKVKFKEISITKEKAVKVSKDIEKIERFKSLLDLTQNK